MVILEPMLPVATKAFFLTLLQLSETHRDVVPVGTDLSLPMGTDLSLPMGRRVEPVPGLMLHLCSHPRIMLWRNWMKFGFNQPWRFYRLLILLIVGSIIPQNGPLKKKVSVSARPQLWIA